MKKALLLTGLLLVLAAPAAMAAVGCNLAWGTECWGQATSPSNVLTFACASNTTPANWKMTASFAVPNPISDYVSFDAFVEGVSEVGNIPDFWKMMQPGDCRNNIAGVVTANVVYSGANGTCSDPTGGAASGGVGGGLLNPGQLQLEAVFAIGAPGVPLSPGVETYAVTYVIKNGNTVGACAGCQSGMVFGLHHVDVAGLTSSVTLDDPLNGGNQCLVWQHAFAGQPCNAPVPTRNTTWGQVKSLYR